MPLPALPDRSRSLLTCPGRLTPTGDLDPRGIPCARRLRLGAIGYATTRLTPRPAATGLEHPLEACPLAYWLELRLRDIEDMVCTDAQRPWVAQVLATNQVDRMVLLHRINLDLLPPRVPAREEDPAALPPPGRALMISPAREAGHS
jgi:hypothetical protein